MTSIGINLFHELKSSGFFGDDDPGPTEPESATPDCATVHDSKEK